jgi:hypothetical protein
MPLPPPKKKTSARGNGKRPQSRGIVMEALSAVVNEVKNLKDQKENRWNREDFARFVQLNTQNMPARHRRHHRLCQLGVFLQL